MSASICGSPSVVLSTVNRNRINLWGNSKTKWFSDRVRFHLHLFIFYIIFTCHCEPRSAGRSNLYNKDRFVSRRDVGILAMTDYIEGMFMCGIFGYVGFRKNAPSIVLVGLKKLEYRGYDSWGVAAVIQNLEFRIQNKKEKLIAVKKRVGKIGSATVEDMPESTLGFGHTRWATHGGVTDSNAHPHLDCTNSIAVVHNGIFENYEEVKGNLLKKGHRFISETDTEVIAHCIEEYLKQGISFTEAVRRTFNEMEGLNAIIIINSHDQMLVAIRNGSPLVIGFGKGENFLASDASALLPHTKTVHFMEDNEMAVVAKDRVTISHVKTGKPIGVSKQQLIWKASEAEKGRYPHFMLKEIYEQPDVVTGIASRIGEVELLASKIRLAHGTYFVGCGTASYAALAGTYLFSKIANRHVNFAIGSEFGYHLNFLNKKSLVIAISQSGETMDILESVKKAKERGATICALVNVVGSSLYRLADVQLPIGAGPEKGVASTKAFIGMLAHMTLLAYACSGNVKEGKRVLSLAVKSMKAVLSDQSVDHIIELSKKLKAKEHICVIGRGLSYPTALETALKIKEISYIHAEGLAAGELKHGPLALVEKGTICIAFLPNDETYGANLAGAMEMKARGGFIIGISHKPHGVFDFFIPVLDAREATIIPNIVAGQLLAYYLSTLKGLDPDKPRNLAKSVTVK